MGTGTHSAYGTLQTTQMNNVFFSSDMHFRHKNIIKYSNRPWPDVDNMREGLILRHNEVVKPNDFWYHLGDFAFADGTYIKDVITRLNGKKIFLKGNHDSDSLFIGLAREGLIQEFRNDFIGKINDLKFHMYHFPIQSWDGARHGTVHLHGHSHGSTPSPKMLRMDVGVDCHNWYPVSYDQVADWAKKMKQEIGDRGMDPGRDRNE